MASKISPVLALLMFTVFSLMSLTTFAVSPTELFAWGKDFGKVKDINRLREPPDPNDKNYGGLIASRTFAGMQFIESIHNFRLITRNDKTFHQEKIKQVQRLLFQDNWIIELMTAFKYSGSQIVGSGQTPQAQANLILLLEAIHQAEEHYNAVLVAFEGVMTLEAEIAREDARKKLHIISNFMALYNDTNNLNILSVGDSPESASSIAEVKRTIRNIPIDHFDDEYRLHISNGRKENSFGTGPGAK